MQGVKGSFRVVGEGGIFEKVCDGSEKSGSRARYSAARESFPTPIGSDRSHPCSFKGYSGVQEERGVGRDVSRKLHMRATL